MRTTATHNAKLTLKKSVVTKFKTAAGSRNPVAAVERRRIFTCCDGASYASTPYIGL